MTSTCHACDAQPTRVLDVRVFCSQHYAETLRNERTAR